MTTTCTKRELTKILADLLEETIEMNNDLLTIGKGRPTTPFSPIGEANHALLFLFNPAMHPKAMP